MTDSKTSPANLLATLVDLNEVILRSRDRQSLFNQICEIAVRQGPFHAAIIWWIDPSEPRRPMKAALVGRFPQRFVLQHLDLDTYRGYSPALVAMHTNQVEVSQDIREDAHHERRSLPGRWEGIGSCAGFPLHENGRIAGALSLFASETHAFGDASIDLLSRLSKNVSFALGNFAREAEREAAVTALAEREHQLRVITDNLPAMIAS